MLITGVREIIHRKSDRGEFFTVVWSDNTKTTVKLKEGEVSDDYTAFLYAVGKKCFPNKGEARQFIADKKSVFEDRVALQSERNRAFKERKQYEANLKARGGFRPTEIEALVHSTMFVPCGAVVKSELFNRRR